MSASLLTAPTLRPPATARRKPSRTTMATCVDNCRTKPSIIPAQIDRPLYKYIEFSRPGFTIPAARPAEEAGDDRIWATIQDEARLDVEDEPVLRKYYWDLILSHDSFESALATHLATKLSVTDLLPIGNLREIFLGVISEEPAIGIAARADLRASRDRDPACSKMAHCFLYYKGFLACQAHRVAHRLWSTGRRGAALLIQSRTSEAFAVDIHPGARIGSGVLLDHATGVVIGETAVVGDDVSILHGVTLGGTGKDAGDRHPKIGDGVLVGAGTQILGNVWVGAGAKIGAGSVVLKSVPPRATAVGNPARLLGGKENPVRLDKMAGLTMDHTSWSGYVI